MSTSFFEIFYSFCVNKFINTLPQTLPILTPQGMLLRTGRRRHLQLSLRNTNHSHHWMLREVFLRLDFPVPLANASRRSIPWGLRLGRIYGWIIITASTTTAKYKRSSIYQMELLSLKFHIIIFSIINQNHMDYYSTSIPMDIQHQHNATFASQLFD